VPIVWKTGSLNVLEPSGPVQGLLEFYLGKILLLNLRILKVSLPLKELTLETGDNFSGLYGILLGDGTALWVW
jgi:hypothetical protein